MYSFRFFLQETIEFFDTLNNLCRIVVSKRPKKVQRYLDICTCVVAYKSLHSQFFWLQNYANISKKQKTETQGEEVG